MDGGDAPTVLYMMTENNLAKISEALEAGTTDFLMKPIDRDQVEAKFTEMGLDGAQDAASA
jgi:two-component system chemotaxis response regulator CheY